MPLYTYQNPQTGEATDLIQTMTEEHSYIDENGLEWKRVFQVPNAAVDSRIDANNPLAFIDATKNKKGTFGDLLDKSAELSDKRASTHGGQDPVKQKFLNDYSNKTKGKKHPSLLKKSYESKNVKVDY
jgi:hypothetical protein